jgi:hypothetical protein
VILQRIIEAHQKISYWDVYLMTMFRTSLSRITLGVFQKPTKFLILQRRNLSFYNSDIAALTGDQAEVSTYPDALELESDVYSKFRNAVLDFSQREVAPRAAEIDRSNNSPSVGHIPFRPTFSPHFNLRIYGRNSGKWAF